MKKLTSTFALGLLASASFSMAAQATFEQSATEFWTTHRTAALMGDFTNNDNLDIFYGGQGNNLFNDPVGWWWQIQQNFCINDGNGNFTIDGYTFQEREYVDEESGETRIAYDRVWNNHGLIGSTYNQYAALDYNNDGLLDILLFGRTEWDIFLNDDEKNLDRYLLLYKNLGEGKFELVQEAAFPKMKPDNDSKNYSLAVGDYDRDGYVDFAVSATDLEREDNYPGRTVSLYRNIDGTGVFKDMKIAETKGGVYTNEVKDDDGNVIVEKQLLEGYFLPVSGDVHFADLNNDGWLDIVVTGWADNNWDGIHNAGNTGKIYLNQNGEKFVDATPDTPGFVTLRSSASSIADFDKDGYLDLFQTGWGDNGYAWNAFLFYNNNDNTTFFEEPLTCDNLGLDGTEGCRQIIRDFDGDGYLDIYYSGSEGCQIYYGNLTGGFNKGEGLPSYSSGHAAVGDINKNGLSDIFMCGYGDNGAYAALHLNTTASVEAPAAPENVKAEVIDGKLVITWDYDTDEAMANDVVYNVYVKNAEGKVYTVVPANPETGFVKVGYGRTVGIRPQLKEYSITAPAGDCTVGVQAISTANETYSAFATATAEGTGVAAIDSAADATATYYNVQGQRVDNPAKGQLLIQVKGNQATKVIF
ncbi:MAG: VCBS repeat-containing protein [Muribaculaceae bacterium]|nr:VCBS repeat-containing protein [Muribaculaceae bacterium]